MEGSDSIRQRSSNLGSLLIVVALIVAGLVFLATTLTTGDFLWFIPTFGERPATIVVHCAGEVVSYSASSPEFAMLTESINRDLSGNKGNPDIGLSEQTLDDYWNTDLVLEIIYPRPVRLHTSFRYGLVDTLIYPVTGVHAPEGIVFGRRGDLILTGVDIGDGNGSGSVAAALNNLGYRWEGHSGCAKP